MCSPVLFSLFINDLAVNIINAKKHDVSFSYFFAELLICCLQMILLCYLKL